MSDLESLTFTVGSERKRIAFNTVETLVLEPDSDEAAEWLDALTQVVKKIGEEHDVVSSLDSVFGDEERDMLTMGELLARNGLDMDDLRRERRLMQFDPVADLSVGDIVAVQRVKHGDPEEVKYGVVSEIDERDGTLDARAKITWEGTGWSVLKNTDQDLRIGRGRMMNRVYDITVVDPDDAPEAAQDLREDVLASLEIDKQAEAVDVEVLKQWETDGATLGDRATDLHARLRLSGGVIGDDGVTVHCRNLFDFGWTANVEADLDEEVEKVAIRAARNNSPIPTNTRL